jgi:hypothetical protein
VLTWTGLRRTMEVSRVVEPAKEVRRELDDVFGELARGGWSAALVRLRRLPNFGDCGAPRSTARAQPITRPWRCQSRAGRPTRRSPPEGIAWL